MDSLGGSRVKPFIVRSRCLTGAEYDRIQMLTASVNQQQHRFISSLLDDALKLVHRRGRFPVHFLDHVAAPHAPFFSRGARRHLSYAHTCCLRRKAKLPCDLRRKLIYGNAATRW